MSQQVGLTSAYGVLALVGAGGVDPGLALSAGRRRFAAQEVGFAAKKALDR